MLNLTATHTHQIGYIQFLFVGYILTDGPTFFAEAGVFSLGEASRQGRLTFLVRKPKRNSHLKANLDKVDWWHISDNPNKRNWL
jgi:hypothetical protein